MRGDYGVGLISAGADTLSPIGGTIPAPPSTLGDIE